MPKKNIGKVQPIEKVWLNKKEIAAYLGVSERYVEQNINLNPAIELYRLSERVYLYNKKNIDEVIMRTRI